MRFSDPEGSISDQSWEQRTSLVSKVLLVARNAGRLIVDHFSGINAGFKFQHGLDLTTPFTPRQEAQLGLDIAHPVVVPRNQDMN